MGFSVMPSVVSRRKFIAYGVSPAAAQAFPECSASGFDTPYKYGKLVLSASENQGDYDSKTVDCPFVFRHEDRFYMTFVAFDGVGYQTGLASSSDLVRWEKQGAILKRDASSPVVKYNIAMNWILRENALRSQGDLVKIDGRFVGAYHAYPNEGLEQGAAVIGLCYSEDLRNWEVGPPVLHPDDGAPWEHGGLYKPCILKHRGSYYIFYNAKNQTKSPWHEQTGVAMSSDLKHWTRYLENPVIPNGGSGSPDEIFASDPCVLQDGDKWAFYYFGLDAKGVARDLLATGRDLFHPEKCKQVIVDVGAPGSVDSRYAHKPSLIQHEGDLYHFYCAVSSQNGKSVRGISVARSRPWL